MREAVIVSTARTPIGKAYRGAYNNTQGQEIAGHAIAHAVKRAGIDPGEVEDVILGCALQQGSTGGNVARQALLRAGLPVTVSGMTIDRQCSSGLMAIATAAKQIIDDGMQITVGGGVESISLVQNDKINRFRGADPWLVKNIPADLHDDDRDGGNRRRALRRQPRSAGRIRAAVAAAHGARRRPKVVTTRRSRRTTTIMTVTDKETGATSEKEITLKLDEGNRPKTTLEDLQKLQPVFKGGQRIKEGRFITAGNASQLSDGAAALVLMEAKEAEKRGLKPLGAYRGMMVAGCGPEEMGIGPVFAVPKLLAEARPEDGQTSTSGS